MTVAEPWTELATRVLAGNPGPMTLDGTNSLVLRHPGSRRVIVIDPGPPDHAHIEELRSHGSIELILLTHHHIDHSESAGRRSTMAGAVVRAADPALCSPGAAPLVDEEVIQSDGYVLRVVRTPGHTADSTCFFLADDRPLDVMSGDVVSANRL